MWQLEPMLDILYQSKKMRPSLKIKNQAGSKVDLAPNLRGDLNDGEVALSKSNAVEVLRKYAIANDVSLNVAKNTKLGEINDWLEKNPVHMFLARSPIPHAGGAMSVFLYDSADAIGTIVASGYFNSATNELKQNDVIIAVGSTGCTRTVDMLVVSSATGESTVTTINGT